MRGTATIQRQRRGRGQIVNRRAEDPGPTAALYGSSTPSPRSDSSGIVYIDQYASFLIEDVTTVMQCGCLNTGDSLFPPNLFVQVQSLQGQPLGIDTK